MDARYVVISKSNNVTGVMIMKNKIVIIGMALAAVVVVSYLFSVEAIARTDKMLKGEIYTTPLGDTVEIIDVPKFGTCLLANAYVICK